MSGVKGFKEGMRRSKKILKRNEIYFTLENFEKQLGEDI